MVRLVLHCITLPGQSVGEADDYMCTYMPLLCFKTRDLRDFPYRTVVW